MNVRILIFLFLSLIVSQQSFSQNEYKASMAGWEVDLNEAYKKSVEKGIPILANFTGTDWCGWCIRLKKSVFTTDAFKKWAKENVILLEVDFPRRFKLPAAIANQNAGLQQAFQVRGYPTIFVFNMFPDKNTGKVNLQSLARTSYKATPAEFIGDLERQIKASKAKNPN